MTVDFCQSEQRRAAEEYIETGSELALLGVHDWFAEEFLMEREESNDTARKFR